MLIKLPDGMWIDPKSVKAIYGENESCIGIDLDSTADVYVHLEDCNKDNPEMTLQNVADSVAEQINIELGRRF